MSKDKLKTKRSCLSEETFEMLVLMKENRKADKNRRQKVFDRGALRYCGEALHLCGGT